MASDTDLRRRVTRLENDTESLYELITEIRTTQLEHGRRLDGIDQRFDGIDQRFDGIDSTLTEVLRRLPEPS